MEGNIKRGLEEIGYRCMNWFQISWGNLHGRVLADTVMNLRASCKTGSLLRIGALSVRLARLQAACTSNEVSVLVKIHTMLIFIVTPCSLVGRCQSFGVTYCLRQTLKKEAICRLETLVGSSANHTKRVTIVKATK
jgi:hypothetical protein